MNYLNTFTYLEDMDQPEDPLWQKSFKNLQSRGYIPYIENASEPFAVDYEPHWSVHPDELDVNVYVPGMKGKTMGVRKPRNIMYLLCHPEANIRGNKLVQCCGDVNCVNPAHMYVVSNRMKLYEQLFHFITDEEWELIRGEILLLEARRDMSTKLKEEAIRSNQSTAHITKGFEFFDGNNDQILTRAIQRHAKNIPSVKGVSNLMPVLKQYQLVTIYGEMRKESRDLVEQLICMPNPGEITAALVFVATWCKEEKMKEALQCLNIQS